MEGVAEAEAIDTIAKLGFAHPDGPARARRPDRPRHVRLDHGGPARGPRRPEVRAVPAAPPVRRGGSPGPEVRPRVLRVLRDGLRASPPSSPRTTGPTPSSSTRCSGSSCGASRMPRRSERALAKLADGTLSRATLVHELAGERGVRARAAARRRRRPRARRETATRADPLAPGAAGHGRARRGDPVGALAPSAGGSRARGRLRVRRDRRISAGSSAPGVELVGVDLATRDVEGMETVEADVRELPFADESFDQILLVSTLEHVGADNSVYGLEAEADAGSRHAALRELGRVLRRDGSLLVTVPLGEPGDSRVVPAGGRARAGRRSSRDAGFFVEEHRGVRAHRGGLACGAGLRGRRRALRRTRARRPRPFSAPTLARAGSAGCSPRPARRSRTDPHRRRAGRDATSASSARETAYSLPRWTSS